jgi:hypothetical protein
MQLCTRTPIFAAERLEMHHVTISARLLYSITSFLALLPDAPFVRAYWVVNQNSVIVTADLARLCFGWCGQPFGFDLFQKFFLDGVPPFLPPLLL